MYLTCDNTITIILDISRQIPGCYLMAVMDILFYALDIRFLSIFSPLTILSSIHFCYGYIDFSLHFLLLPFLLSFYHLLIPLKSKSPFHISAIHFPQSWNLFY